jgi:mannosyl-3-phosphoglycerate phosphatase
VNVRDLLVVTDLDGTLLDETTYAFDEAREALAALRLRGARLTLATSKTRAEVAALLAELEGPVAAIVENGGAVVIPPGFGRAGVVSSTIRLGVARDVLVEALRAIAAETGASLRGFADLDAGDVARLTGLPLDGARLARQREFDEPFLLDDEGRLGAVAAAAAARELLVTRGGRFHHLLGRTDKGAALRVLLDHLATCGVQPFTVGLGDAANDLPFLSIVEHPIIVPRSDGRPDETLAAGLPHAVTAPWPGPAGWNAAVLGVLRELDSRSPTASRV